MTIELYGWGANSHGQLGLGCESEQEVIPKRINLSRMNINPLDIKCIVGGAGHTLILLKSGRLFGCGWNNKCQVGLPNTGSSDMIPSIEPINTLNVGTIVDVACGWDSSLALNENGEIFAWGSNYYGQLGLKRILGDDKCVQQPTKVPIHGKIKRISMGLRHSAVVTDDGQVLVTGAGSKCQLGIVNSSNQPISSIDSFTPVPELENIIDVACGQYFTMVLDVDGDVFAWGNNKHDQLGVDKSEVSSSIKPIKLEKRLEIKTIGAGWTHASVLLHDGIYFAWGRSDYGQLGNYSDDSIRKCPSSIDFKPNIQQLCVGSEHNVALDDEGTIYSWGWNEHGNCGNGAVENVFQPCEIFLENKIVGLLIGTGAAHSFALVKDGIS